MVKFKVRAGNSLKKADKILKESKARTNSLMNYVSYRAASKAKEAVEKRIPKGWERYKESLSVKETNNPNTYAITANVPPRVVSADDASNYVLYVVGPKNVKKKAKGINVLEYYSPWTLDTIPFIPSKKDAKIISRKVTEREVLSISNRREKDKPLWRNDLSKEGIKINIFRKPIKVDTFSDAAFEALRLEKGIGMPASPHWGPAIHNLKNGGILDIFRETGVKSTLYDPNFTGWKHWENINTNNTLNSSDLKKLMPFQKKIKG